MTGLPTPAARARKMRSARHDAEREGVDQDVAVVAGVEVDLAADRRHADAVAVAADAGDHAAARRYGVRGWSSAPKRSEFEVGDRPRAHGEDVAQDAADAGRRALVRLDERRVVVALDLEDRGEPVADVDRAGVLARALQHARARRRQLLQVARASSCS